jgi:hypothetical protein
MNNQQKLILSYLLFAISGLSGLLALNVATKPSVMPIATVMGAFAIPALFFWWGLILYRSSKKEEK